MATFAFTTIDGRVFGLHPNCPWQIRGINGLVTGNADILEPAFNTDNHFDWDQWYDGDWEKFDGANRYDFKIREFFSTTSENDRIVTRVHGAVCGSCFVVLKNGVEIRVIVCCSSAEREMWRFFEKGNLDSHFVVKGAN